MEFFVLWLHFLVTDPVIKSEQLVPHPVQYDTLAECEQKAKEWTEQRLKELGYPESYAVVHKCERQSVVMNIFGAQTHLM